MPERPKGHDWKSCVPTKIGTEGSNPSLSAMNHVGFMAGHASCVVHGSPELDIVRGARSRLGDLNTVHKASPNLQLLTGIKTEEEFL